MGSAAVGGPELSIPEQERLATGQVVVVRTILEDGSKRGLAVQRIAAPAHIVWDTLVDFQNWSEVPGNNCVASEVYDSSGDEQMGRVKAKITLGVAWLKIAAHCDHVVDRAAGRLTWTLDESQPNDVLTNEGYWLVRPDPEDPANYSQVCYCGVVVLAAWAPAWANTFLCEAGLPKAVGWIRKEAERRHGGDDGLSGDK